MGLDKIMQGECREEKRVQDKALDTQHLEQENKTEEKKSVK